MGDSDGDHAQSEEPTEEQPPPGLDENRLHRALASAERRRLLYYLLEETESTVEELATVLSGWQATTTETMQTPADRSKFHLRLVHIHLPHLADSELIDYDRDAGLVQLASLHPETADVIRQSVDTERTDES